MFCICRLAQPRKLCGRIQLDSNPAEEHGFGIGGKETPGRTVAPISIEHSS